MSPSFWRFFVAMVVAGGLFIPHFAFAQLDQKCWTKTACTEARKRIIADTQDTLSQDQINQGFWQDSITEEACGGLVWGKEPVGFCLPAGKATTEISFGGENRFSDIGQFIKSMYRYTIWAAAILAAAMLIVAGFQWAASGGSSDAISSAKKKISGAIAGLLLLLLSYTVLNTINPYLVNFRLPDVWLINKIGFAQFCDQLDEGDKVTLASEDPNQKLSEAERIEKFKNAEWDKAPDKKGAECGKQYTFQSGGGQTCHGTSCDGKVSPAVCMPEFNNIKEECKATNVGGLIFSSSIIDNSLAQIKGVTAKIIAKATADAITDYWEWNWSSDNNGLFLVSVCQDSKKMMRFFSQVTDGGIDEDEKNHKQWYTTKVVSATQIDEKVAQCTSKGFEFMGFGLVVPLNLSFATADEGHLIGRTKDGNAIDLGDLPDASLFQLHKLNPLAYSTYTDLFQGDIDTYQVDIVTEEITGYVSDYFISADQLKKGVRLNIDVSQICLINGSVKIRKQCYGKYGYADHAY